MSPSAAVLDMAKRERKKPGPKPVDGGRTAVMLVRSTEAWKAWLERFAEFKRLTVSDVVDQSVVSYARNEGFPEAAPKR